MKLIALFRKVTGILVKTMIILIKIVILTVNMAKHIESLLLEVEENIRETF